MSTLQEIDAVTKSLRERCNRQAQTITTMKEELIAAREHLHGVQVEIEKAGVGSARDLGEYIAKLEASRERFEGWLTIADGTDDESTALAAFMEWRGNGYAGDPLDFLRAAAGESADELERPSAQLGLDDGWRNGPRDDDDPLWTDCDCGTCSKALDEGATRFEDPPGGRKLYELLTQSEPEIVVHLRKDVHGFACGATYGTYCSELTEVTCTVCRTRAGVVTVSDHLHAAQLAARQHVVPHIVLAAELARAEGKTDEWQTFVGIAAVIDGALDPMILRYGEAFLRFVRGSDT